MQIVTDFFSFLDKYLWINDLGVLNVLAFLLSVYVHEHGHYFTAKRLGLNPKRPIIIPFVGAYVSVENSKNNLDIFKIAIAGPVLGTVFGLVCFYINLLVNNNFIYQLALFSLLINLANLIPLPFLDGGRIIKSLGIQKAHILITIALFGTAIAYKSYPIAIVGILWLIIHIFTKDQTKSYIPVKRPTTYIGTTLYLILILVLTAHTYLILA